MSLATVAAVMLVHGRALAEDAQGPPLPQAPQGGRVLSLGQVEQVALSHQPQVLVARAATNTAVALADQARAPLLPQVSATAEYVVGNTLPRQTVGGTTTSVGGTTTSGVANSGTPSFATALSQTSSYWSFGLSASQLIYDFGQTNGRYRAADLNAEAMHQAELTTRLNILLGTRQAYFNARAMKELVKVADETFADQNKHLVQVQGMVQVGTQPPIALAQQQAAVANAKFQLITSQNNYETAKAQLNQAAGMVGGTDYDVSDEEPPPVEDEDQSLAMLVPKALANRPEMATFLKQRESQEASLSAAKGGYGPTFSAAAAASEAGSSLDNLGPIWSGALILNWPIFQGGLTKGQIRQAEAGVQSVDAQRSLEELQIRLSVDSARLAVHAAKSSIGAAEDALTSAREQLRLAEQRYATGVGDIIELNDAQVAYTSAAAQVVQAHFTLATARAQLLAAMGRQ
jgi:outer membrane protein